MLTGGAEGVAEEGDGEAGGSTGNEGLRTGDTSLELWAFTKECDDVTFTEGDAQLVDLPHNDPLVIKAKVGNNNLYRILVDNGNTADILYLEAYKKMGLSEDLLKPVVTPLYGFTGDFLIPRGAISLPITVGDEPRISTVMTEFLIVDWTSTFNAVIG